MDPGGKTWYSQILKEKKRKKKKGEELVGTVVSESIRSSRSM